MSKANLTLSLDAGLLKRARMKALEEGTSVNAVVREQLEHYAAEDSEREAIEDLLAISDRTHAGSGADGRSWTREGLYEGRLSRGGGKLE